MSKTLNLKSIRFKLMAGGVIAVLLPLLVVGYLATSKASKALKGLSMDQAQGIASDLARSTHNSLMDEINLAGLIAGQRKVIDLLEALADTNGGDSDTLRRSLFEDLKWQFAGIDHHYQGIAVIDLRGQLITGILDNGDEYRGVNVGDKSYFKETIQGGKTVLSDVTVSLSTGHRIVVACAPVRAVSGRLVGAVGSVIKVDYISDLVASRKIGTTGYGFMVDKLGLAIAHPNKDRILKLDISNVPEMAAIASKMLAGKTGVESYVLDGTNKIAGYAPVGINGWSVGATQNESEFLAATAAIRNSLILVAILAGIIIAAVILVAANAIVRPINGAVEGLKDIAQGEGDLTMRLKVTSQDEVGALAKWFNVFIEKLQGIMGEITTGVQTLSSSATELSAISEHMVQNIHTVSETANTVSAASEEMSSNMSSVAAAMEETSTNASMVATASEEMSATIAEIAKHAEEARGISNEATHKASDAATNMDELGAAANAIGKVVETITDISEQVNLLALNATIEAARAGEAGKGFAVVANEIKELAKQTAEASHEIKQKIQGIQGTTTTTVSQIGEINQVILQVNDLVATIATAVEEQSVATRDIAANVAQASKGIQEVNENVNQSSTVSAEIARDIANVSASMNEMTNSSTQVSMSSHDLSKLSEKLEQMVSQFRI